MTDALNPTVAAGWYADPWGSTSQRWWDGTAWTGNLYPQPEAQQKPESPEPALDDAGETLPAAEADYQPVAVRSTYEAAPSYRTAAAPTLDSPYPSRRALRELTTELPRKEPAAAVEDTVADALPAFTQAPEFSPEPVATLPPPVWSERVEAPETAEPEAVPEAGPEAETAAEPEAETTSEPEAPATDPEAPAAGPAPAATVTSAVAPTDDGWAASLTRWDDVDTASAPPDALPIFGDAPPVSYSQRAMRYQPLHGRTSPVWLIVFMPVLQAASVVGSIFLFPGLFQFDARFGAFVPSGDVMALLLGLRDWVLFAVLPLTLAFFLFTFILGFQDRARLRLLGHDQTASPWWIVLSPLVYLVVRSVRVRQCTGRRGSGPLTTYVCLYIAPAIALFIAQAVASAFYGAIPA